MFRLKRSHADFSAEIEAHLNLETERLREQGLSDDEAAAAARRAFGNTTRATERFYESGRWLWWDHFRQDLRYAARLLCKAPGFTIVTVLIMALGIGATTAIFSVVNATLLAPLPYPDSDRLVSIEDDFGTLGALDVGMSQPEWLDLQRSGIFDDVSPAWFDENNLTGGSRPERVRILIVAPNYFELLGVKPQLGRTFDPRNDSPGILPEVVISDGAWKRMFGGDPHVLGRSIRMDTDQYQIIGVMPAGFDAPGRVAEERNIDIWPATSFYGAPMVIQPPRKGRNLPTAIARLKSGLTMAEAQRRVDALVAALKTQFPADYPVQNGWRVQLLPLKNRIVGTVRQSLTLLLGAVAVVLLIGCVNVANLVLARAGGRAREMAMRQALGAARGRLVRQLLTESILLSVLGGIAGIALLLASKGLLLRLVPDTLPRLNAISINTPVLIFALAVSVATGIVFGLVPALHADRFDVNHVLKQEGRGSAGSHSRARTRRALVVTECALSLVLMASAGLLLRSFWDLAHVRLGFDRANVMSIRTRLPYPNNVKIDRYPSAAAEAPFLQAVLRRARALPGVVDAAFGDPASIPLDETHRDLNVITSGVFFVTFEGREIAHEESTIAVDRTSVTPEYFHLLGLSLQLGRLFNEFDTHAAPAVAVVNETFARTYWPGQNPLGRRFRSARSGSPWISVVGVIADARTESLADGARPFVYLDLYQTGGKHLTVFLRGQLDVAAIPDEVRAQVQAVDPSLPVFGARTLDATISSSLAGRRFALSVVGLFALTAVLLAGLGVYGVVSYVVSERRREIGIRLALGADGRGITRGIVWNGLKLTAAGAAAGLLGALITSRVMTGLLYGVAPADVPTFAAVTTLLLAVGLAACYVPARRATRVNPTEVLRSE